MKTKKRRVALATGGRTFLNAAVSVMSDFIVVISILFLYDVLSIDPSTSGKLAQVLPVTVP